MPYKDKEDQRKHDAKYYQANKNRIIIRVMEYNKIRVSYRQAILNRYRRMKGCIICGERDPNKLLFHHSGDYIYGLVNTLLNCSWKRLKEEVAACDVLCRACHNRVHKGGLTYL